MNAHTHTATGHNSTSSFSETIMAGSLKQEYDTLCISINKGIFFQINKFNTTHSLAA